jgi:amidohydrolase
MHACGHDGHMAMVLGVGKWLKESRPETGRVILLFQPAEETGEGAALMMQDERFKELDIDRAVALHNLPGYTKNSVFIKENTFASASVGLEVQFRGKSSHAAYPDEGENPALAISTLVKALEDVKEKALSHKAFRILTVTYIKLGEPAFGINPGQGEIGITVRAETDEGMEEIITDVKSIIDEIRREFDGDINVERREPFSAAVNDEEGVAVIASAAEELDIPVEKLEDPFAWSEDFGDFRKKCPITLFGLGAGKETPALHSEVYNFDDGLIPVGTALFCEFINQINHG